MRQDDSFVHGTVFFNSTMEELARILETSGIEAAHGEWSMRLFAAPSRVKISYVRNISPASPFQVEVDGYGVPNEVVAARCERLAQCLKSNGVSFDMTHFTPDGKEIRKYKA